MRAMFRREPVQESKMGLRETIWGGELGGRVVRRRRKRSRRSRVSITGLVGGE